MTFVKLVQEEIAATKDDTEQATGYRQGLTQALALMLLATVDESQVPQ